MSQCILKRIEEAFGWIKMVAGMRQTRFRGLDPIDLAFTFAAVAYNPRSSRGQVLVRLPMLLAETPP